jgi:hypothetical protein
VRGGRSVGTYRSLWNCGLGADNCRHYGTSQRILLTVDDDVCVCVCVIIGHAFIAEL